MPYDLYPAVNETYDFPPEVRIALHKSVELRNTVDPMTTVARNNLTAAEKWDGRVIVNTDTDHLERWDAGLSQWITLVNSNGDILTGNYVFNNGTGKESITIAGDTEATIFFNKGGTGGGANASNRWAFFKSSGPTEDLGIAAYDDAGVYLGSPISIQRVAGLVTLQRNPVDPMNIATKNYVDNVGPAWQNHALVVRQGSGAGVPVAGTTQVARYLRVGKIVHWHVRWGATAVGNTGAIQVCFPPTMIPAHYFDVGHGMLLLADQSKYYTVTAFNDYNGDAVRLFRPDISTTYSVALQAGDGIILNMSYEVA